MVYGLIVIIIVSLISAQFKYMKFMYLLYETKVNQN